MDKNLTRLAVSGCDRPFELWDVSDLRRPEPLASPPDGPSDWHNVAFGPDEESIIWTAVEHGKIALWDGRSQSQRTVAEPNAYIHKFSASLDGTTVATITNDRKVCVYDVQTGERRMEWSLPPRETAEESARQFEKIEPYLSPGGQRLLLYARPVGPTRIYDLQAGQFENVNDTKLPEFRGLDFSADGRLIAGPLDNTGLVVADAVSHDVLARMRMPSLAGLVAFSSDARTLASVGADGRVHLWGVATGQELLALDELSGNVLLLKFSADGKRLGAVVRDEEKSTGKLFIWSVEPS